jgi:epoxide hydrolase-like predicted phosphatase
VIKFVYFDIGGVIVQDFTGTDKWLQLKRDMGIKPEQDQEFDQFFDELEKKVHTGEHVVQTMVSMISRTFGIRFPDGYDFLEDFVGRFEKNETIWPTIEKVKSKYRVGLLTNMYPGMLDLIYKKDLMPKTKWNLIVDSSNEQMQKPDKGIYELSQERAGVEHSEIFFTDNLKENLVIPKKLGWKTFWYDPKNPAESTKQLELVLEKILYN